MVINVGVIGDRDVCSFRSESLIGVSLGKEGKRNGKFYIDNIEVEFLRRCFKNLLLGMI